MDNAVARLPDQMPINPQLEEAYRRIFEYDPDLPGWMRLRQFGGVIAYPSRLRIVESYTTYGAYEERV